MYNAPMSMRNIAIFLPNPVGDVVMSTPVLRAVRRGAPDARVVHVGRAVGLEVLRGSDLADETVVDLTRCRPKLQNLRRLAGEIRKRRIDLAILLPNSLRPALVAWLGRVRRRAGYVRNGRGLLLTDRLRPPREQGGSRQAIPTIDYYRTLVESVGFPCPSRKMELAVSPEDQQAADELLRSRGIGQNRPVVMLNPGAAFGASKMWPAERYARLADQLIARHGVQIIINAAPVEREVAARVADAMEQTPELSFADRDNTLGMLTGLVRRCWLLVTHDTGARHFGAAMGIGVVTLFGSTDPVWAQIDYEHERIIRVDVPCSPCQSKRCVLPPGPEHHRCMRAINVETVLPAAEELLAWYRQEKLAAMPGWDTERGVTTT